MPDISEQRSQFWDSVRVWALRMFGTDEPTPPGADFSEEKARFDNFGKTLAEDVNRELSYEIGKGYPPFSSETPEKK